MNINLTYSQIATIRQSLCQAINENRTHRDEAFANNEQDMGLSFDRYIEKQSEVLASLNSQQSGESV